MCGQESMLLAFATEHSATFPGLAYSLSLVKVISWHFKLRRLPFLPLETCQSRVLRIPFAQYNIVKD